MEAAPGEDLAFGGGAFGHAQEQDGDEAEDREDERGDEQPVVAVVAHEDDRDERAEGCRQCCGGAEVAGAFGTAGWRDDVLDGGHDGGVAGAEDRAVSEAHRDEQPQRVGRQVEGAGDGGECEGDDEDAVAAERVEDGADEHAG